MSDFVVVVDSGADIADGVIERYGIKVVPFHFSIDGMPFDDGDITDEVMFSICRERKVMPYTSASIPHDYERVFESIHHESPDAHIVYLGYSAATTSSYSSAETAAEDKGWVSCIDTKNVSGSYGLIVEKTCEFLVNSPNSAIGDIKEYVDDLIARTCLMFIPSDLAFLHAGGRLSSASKLAAQVLNIKPVITMKNGRLEVVKRMKGSMKKCAEKTLEAFFEKKGSKIEAFRLLRSAGLSEKVESAAEEICERFGIRGEEWVETGCVISAHCGPASFGFAAIVHE